MKLAIAFRSDIYTRFLALCDALEYQVQGSDLFILE
jgi:hypothetical protein